jgi:hypothetical protein
MAEIQHSPNAGELTQKFIEFIMMQAQQAALCLGQMPHPSTGKEEVNLDAARMFIDHLEIIQEKTRGNLNKDEEKILSGILSELQMAYVHVARGGAAHPSDDKLPRADAPEPLAAASEDSREATSATPSPVTVSEEEGKKKFTKSYGV